MEGNEIEQVHEFKYLGIVFYYRHPWIFHCNSVFNMAKLSSAAIAQFYYTLRNRYILAALEPYKTKVVTQVLYGVLVLFTEV